MAGEAVARSIRELTDQLGREIIEEIDSEMLDRLGFILALYPGLPEQHVMTCFKVISNSPATQADWNLARDAMMQIGPQKAYTPGFCIVCGKNIHTMLGDVYWLLCRHCRFNSPVLSCHNSVTQKNST